MFADFFRDFPIEIGAHVNTHARHDSSASADRSPMTIDKRYSAAPRACLYMPAGGGLFFLRERERERERVFEDTSVEWKYLGDDDGYGRRGCVSLWGREKWKSDRCLECPYISIYKGSRVQAVIGERLRSSGGSRSEQRVTDMCYDCVASLWTLIRDNAHQILKYLLYAYCISSCILYCEQIYVRDNR